MSRPARGAVLLVATVDVHFQAFHLPAMHWLQDQGFEVHVAARGDLALPHCDRRFDLPFRRSPYSPGNASVYRRLRGIIDGGSYALVHCHTPVGGLLGRLASRGARRRGTRVLYTAHGFHFCQGAPWRNWLLYYPVERVLARFTDTLVTITREDHDRAVRRRFPAGRIEHVPGVGVDAERFQPLPEGERRARREALGYGAEELILVYAAEFNANKNQALAIRAAAAAGAALPRWRLLLAGEGPLREPCRELAAALGVTGQVEFLGQRRDLQDLLPLCDLAIAPSRREGLPVNVMEAMACGLPVLAAANRGHRELVVDGQTGGLVPPDDLAALAGGLAGLAARPEARRAMGEAGRARIQAGYSLPLALGAMTRIYASMLGLPGTGSP